MRCLQEDLEVENEELASKLTDLTTQAKKMLLNNESLEESIQDQQIEYEDRIAELESQLAEKYEDSDLASLHSKHRAALDTIVRLKKDIDIAEQGKASEDNYIDANKFKQVEEENMELRQVVDHLSQENNAAKEIKFIVLELKAKNVEITESLRLSQEQNTAALDTIETLKADNEQLRRDMAKESDANHNALTCQNGADENAKMSEMEAELKHYKTIVSQMTSDRNVLNHRLSDLMDLPGPSQLALYDAPPNEQALVPIDSKNIQDPEGTMVVAKDNTEAQSYDQSSYVSTPVTLHPVDGVEEQIQNLTIENGQLAQRLGNAVADKECKKVVIRNFVCLFASSALTALVALLYCYLVAMTTLTKLGAKMEELIERNKLLSSLADMKTQHPSRGANYYSGGHRLNDEPGPRHEVRGRDPDASGDDRYNPSSPHPNQQILPRNDETSVYSDMGSTIMSYEQSKKLEPESAGSYIGGMSIIEEDNKRTQSAGRESLRQSSNNPEEAAVSEEVHSVSKPRLVKVPGGEYFGQLNDCGQKHGNGKMTYDNGNEYDGQWRFNKRDGKGTTKYASGNVYTGKMISYILDVQNLSMALKLHPNY